MERRSVVIVGGGGFIGTNLAHKLILLGYRVKVISRTIDKYKFPATPNLELVELDVNFTSKLLHEVANYEAIVWLVNNLVPSLKMDNYADDFLHNINPIIKLYEGLEMMKKDRTVVFLSSGGTIYGEPNSVEPIKEDATCRPISAYGLSKIVSEEYIKFLTKTSSFISSYILRPSNIYGNNQNFKKSQGIVGYAFKSLLEKKPIDLYGDGKMIRDFLHVEDLSTAISYCISRKLPIATTDIYNVGSQHGTAIKELLDTIEYITGLKFAYNKKDARTFDCNYNVLDTTRIRELLGWTPSIDLMQGIDIVWQFYRTEKK